MNGSRIDAHHHVWDLTVRQEPWIEPVSMASINRSFAIEDLAPSASANGIGTTVVVQTLSSIDETLEFLALAEGSELVGAVTGWTELTAPSVADSLAGLRSAVGGSYLRGIRHQVQDEPDPDWLLREDVRAGLSAVGAAGLVYELLTSSVQLTAAVQAVSTMPDVSFVLDHCSKPPIAIGLIEPWASEIRELATRPNITCKLSGLVTEADWQSWTIESIRPYYEVVLEAFGPDRLMFGSDWPVCLLASSYDDWVDTVGALIGELSEPEQDAIWGDTARRVYGLP